MDNVVVAIVSEVLKAEEGDNMLLTQSRIGEQVHGLLEECIKPGMRVIDGTVGNGHDTLYLSQLVGEEGIVYGFDVQESAIESTKNNLGQAGCTNVELILDNHAKVLDYIDEPIHGAVFNLGYLPGSDKSIITKGNSTVKAVKDMLYLMKKHGHMIITSYYGHPGGEDEKGQLEEFLLSLDFKNFSVTKVDFFNRKNHPPIIYIIEKKRKIN